MNIKIDKLILQNFKGIRNLEINAGGNNLNIYGDNATGKTTVFDAVMWLLFNKDSLGRSDFGIKTQDSDGNTIHNLEHSVECVLTIDDAILTLKKVYAEKWTKKRGSAEAEFSGHETKYYINEVPSSKGEYTAKISSIIDEELFKTITNPLYFNEHLKWQDRRAILLNICGNISDEDVLASSSEFLPLLEELKGRTIQEYQKIIQSKQKGINDELKTLPQRIAEARLAIPETKTSYTEADKETVENKIAELNEEIVAIRNSSGELHIERELKELREQRKQIENKKCDVSSIELERDKFHSKYVSSSACVSDCQRNIKTYFNLADECEKKAEKLREEWSVVNSKQYDGSEICPTCGQPLPAEQIESAKAKFNTARATKLDEITAKGKALKADKEKYIAEHDKWAKLLEEKQADMKMCEDEIRRIDSLIVYTENNFVDEKKAKIEEINSRITEVEKNALNSSETIKSKIDTIQEQIATEKAKLDEINHALYMCAITERQLKRIADLTADEKRLAGEYAELEKTSFLIDEFTKFKISLLSDKINGLFKFAKFKLFDVQINGGVAECCETCYKGVPYSDLNNAAKIAVGIDVIETLSNYYDKHATIITDNAESINEIPKTTSQQINLYVSHDKSLRIEKVV